MTHSLESQIQRALRTVQEQMAAFDERREALSTAVGHGQSENGLVMAEVGGGGEVRDLHIDARAMRLDSYTLRDSVLEAIKAATAHFAEVVRDLVPQTPPDPEQLMKDLGLSADLKSTMDGFQQRANDVEANLAELRRTLGKYR